MISLRTILKSIVRSNELKFRIYGLFAFVPDVPYLKFVYWLKTGRRLDLDHPRGYNEKQNWLKIHDVHPEYTRLVDKLLVRDHVARTIGEEYLIPLLGAWERFEDIDFDALPDEFVLKCNHDSSSVRIVRDKRRMDRNALRRFYGHRLRMNFYAMGREYPYRDVKPMIIAEKLMKQDGETDIRDYKFQCFDGVPKVVFVVKERSTACTMDFFDMDFHPLDVKSGKHDVSHADTEKPRNFERMKELATILSQGMKYVRIDFYDINDRVYFGEFTFFDAGGFELITPEKWERLWGDWIVLD